MKRAAIDIGTNSARLLIADVNVKIKRIEKHTTVTRLGEGVDKEKRISREAMDKNAKVLNSYREIALFHGIEHITAIATSAVRDAVNKEEFLRYMEERTGIKITVISGEEEARLGFLGASSMLSDSNGVIIDIGGGSTEFILGKSGDIVFSKSVNIGAVRLTERFSQYGSCGMASAEEFIFSEISDTIEKIKEYGRVSIVGIGGTVTTLAAIDQELKTYDMDKVHGYILRSSRVEDILNMLFNLRLGDRKKLPGLQAERADIIPYGTLILKTIMEMAGCSEITVSEADNLDGIMVKLYT